MILSSAPCAQAQASQAAPILDSYGSGACQAVLGEVGTGAGGGDVVYAGFGSAVRVLDGAGSPPALVAGLFENPAELHGMVRDLAIVRGNNLDRLYAAAGPAGLAAYDPAGGAVGQKALLTYATSVAALDVDTGSGTRRIVFVGESIEPSGATRQAGTSYAGSIYLYRHVSANSITQLGLYSLPAAGVTCLAVSDQVAANTVTLLAGTTCSGVLRFDFPASAFASSSVTFPTPVTWPASGGPFCRDLEIHQDGATGQSVAFLAAHRDGVSLLDLAGGGLSAVGGSWPLSTATGNAKGVAVVTVPGSPTRTYLLVAFGENYVVESQFWDLCSLPLPCGPPEAGVVQSTDTGLFAYRLDSSGGGGPPFDQPVFLNAETSARLLRVSGRWDAQAGVVWADTAADTLGYRRYRFDPTGPNSPLTLDASHGRPEGAFLNAVDDTFVAEIGGQIYAYSSLENGIGAHVLTPGNPNGLFSNPPVTVTTQGSAVVIAGMTTSSPPFLVTSGTDDAKLHDLSNPQNPHTVPGVVTLIDRSNYFTEVFPGLGSAVPPAQPANWLISTFSEYTSQDPVAGFEIFDLDPVVTSQNPNASSAQQILVHTQFPLPPSGSEPSRNFGGVAVRRVSDTELAVYVAYLGAQARRFRAAGGGTIANTADYGAGLIAYKVELVKPPGQPIRYDVTKMDERRAFTGLTPTARQRPALVTYDAVNNRVYAAMGCLGAVQFQLSGPYTIQPAIVRSPTFTLDGVTATRSAVHAIDIGGTVYTSYLGGFPAVFATEPAGTFGSASVTPTYFASPMQPVTIRAFSTSSGLIRLLADARGGVHALQ